MTSRIVFRTKAAFTKPFTPSPLFHDVINGRPSSSKYAMKTNTNGLELVLEVCWFQCYQPNSRGLVN